MNIQMKMPASLSRLGRGFMPSPSCFETGTVKSVAWVTEISAFAYHSRAELLCMWLSTGKSNWGHWFHSTPLCTVRGWRTHSLNYSHTGTSFHPLWLHSLAIPHHSPFSHPPSPSSLFLYLFPWIFLWFLWGITSQAPSPKNSPWQHHKAPAVLQEDPPTPRRAASEDKEMLAGAFWFY